VPGKLWFYSLLVNHHAFFRIDEQGTLIVIRINIIILASVRLHVKIMTLNFNFIYITIVKK